MRCSVTAARWTRMESTSTSVDMPAARTDSARFKIGLRRSERLLRGLQALGRQDRAVVGSDDARRSLASRVRRCSSPVICLDRSADFTALRVWPRVIKHLVHRKLGLEIVQRIRPVQGADIEIFNTELVLSQQRTENKDRVVAAGKGFGVVHLGESAGAGLRDARRRSPHSRFVAAMALFSRSAVRTASRSESESCAQSGAARTEEKCYHCFRS